MPKKAFRREAPTVNLYSVPFVPVPKFADVLIAQPDRPIICWETTADDLSKALDEINMPNRIVQAGFPNGVDPSMATVLWGAAQPHKDLIPEVVERQWWDGRRYPVLVTVPTRFLRIPERWMKDGLHTRVQLPKRVTKLVPV